MRKFNTSDFLWQWVRFRYSPQVKTNHLSILFGRWFFDSAISVPIFGIFGGGLFKFKRVETRSTSTVDVSGYVVNDLGEPWSD